MNYLYYLIKLLSLFPACVIYSPFVALSIFVVLSNLCRIIKLLPSSHPLLSTHFFTLPTHPRLREQLMEYKPSWGFELFSSGFTLVWCFTGHPIVWSFQQSGSIRNTCCMGMGDISWKLHGFPEKKIGAKIGTLPIFIFSAASCDRFSSADSNYIS